MFRSGGISYASQTYSNPTFTGVSTFADGANGAPSIIGATATGGFYFSGGSVFAKAPNGASVYLVNGASVVLEAAQTKLESSLGFQSTSGTVGYTAGAGGTVTQGSGSGKATGVTLSKASGEITMDGAALTAATTVSFTLTNTVIAATDVLVLNHASAGTAGAYTLNAQCAAGSASINVRNVTAGNLSEAIVIRFAVVKGSIT